jgi:uncharacterized membrane protein YeaQ/YmgE (transglycosylase-associated protein family)
MPAKGIGAGNNDHTQYTAGAKMILFSTPLHLLVTLIVAALFGFLGRAIGKPKGHGTLGFFLGFLLTLIGLVIIAVVPRSREAEIAAEQRRQEIADEAAARRSASS